jgi:hypothetical protein
VRTKPEGFVQALGAQWLCVVLDELLGQTDMTNVPALMSGFGSILDHPRAADASRALFSLRQLGVAPASDIQLRQFIYDAVGWEYDNAGGPGYVEPPYRIDAERTGYPFFRRVRSDDPALAGMIATLRAGLPFDTETIRRADPARRMSVITGQGDRTERIGLDLSDLPALPAPPTHDHERRPRGPIEVPIADLEAVAADLDAHDDAAPGRPKGNWLARLRESAGNRKVHALVPDRANGCLVETEIIRLEGLKHLIGLPGTGKTTLIVLLLIWLDRNDYRSVVLLPSIETSLNLLADLSFYGAEVGLLVGQSPETRIEHARKLAERLAGDEFRGFGRTAPGASLLALNCAIGAFDSDPDAGREFPHLKPPCTSIKQRPQRKDGTEGEGEVTRLCPVSGWCGRLRAPRELTVKRIWLGHVLSMDTRIQPHFTDLKIRHFEAIARSVDLVIIDEADGAQAVLDKKAISDLDLTGSEQSYEHALMRDLFTPVSLGRNAMTASNVRQYSMAASDFRALNQNLVMNIQADRARHGMEGPLSRFKDTFITSNNVVTTLFCPPDISLLEGQDRVAEDHRFNAINKFWDGCVRAAMFRRTATDDDDYAFEPDEIAPAIGRTQLEVQEAAVFIANAMRDWISEPLQTEKDATLDRMRARLFGLVPPRADLGREEAADLFRFLVGVTTVVMQFLALIPAQQAMVAEGIHSAPLFQKGISEDLAHVVPESLIGRMSGVRYHLDEGKDQPSAKVQYVAFRGAPRVLMYRLHEMLRHDGQTSGPAVLLASATSYLAESPSYHIPTGPDLILRRASEDTGWRDSLYAFSPIPDPDDPARHLRFSGTPVHQRDRVLRKMVDHYFRSENPLAFEMTRDFDAGRKVGLVVNSYAQVALVKDHLRRTRPDLADRVIGVIDAVPANNAGDWVTASQVERLGARPESWDVIVFPMKALARGVNIVFEMGDRRRDALIGTLVFLARPHPASESLDLVAGITGARTLAFDRAVHAAEASLDDLSAAWRSARAELVRTTRRLLRFPIQASRLGALAKPFTADVMVDVLQTIGRAMRNGCKARVIFADAAWAPMSAAGKRDGRGTSMLVMMRDILRDRLSAEDPIDREVYRALYEPFLHPLERCANINFPDGRDRDDER